MSHPAWDASREMRAYIVDDRFGRGVLRVRQMLLHRDLHHIGDSVCVLPLVVFALERARVVAGVLARVAWMRASAGIATRERVARDGRAERSVCDRGNERDLSRRASKRH